MDLITSLGEAASASGCKQQKQVVQLQLKGTHWESTVRLPDSTEKLEASARAGALGIQAVRIERHSHRSTQQRSPCGVPLLVGVKGG